ncbi:mycothiol system anti-sigma-R factor [Nocardioides sp. zg-1228]|uniref:mycothiol system anti-sigma-R factor n=1 Tax=Nocardioides sp. zg-1228 TaxID=2763008 RepID=UPI001643128A|nr:mycothiol system anti-sigma-R factor [Nocardioides sp. zg-1228]MBC2934038.1 mycothiol system anti-sigma-R factor [Nocardioides sp. zg-1228]QSF58793.1 mycothiol system anti-sigma-R factor [Nocardioides sp. zg-1228]
MSSHEHHGPDDSDDDCVDYIERIVYLLDNELDQADCTVVEMHLRECGPCLERYDLQRAVKQLVARSCSESAPESLRDRVRLQLHQVHVRITDAGA